MQISEVRKNKKSFQSSQHTHGGRIKGGNTWKKHKNLKVLCKKHGIVLFPKQVVLPYDCINRSYKTKIESNKKLISKTLN